MAKDFDYKSGQYNVRLVLGDAAVSNPIDWHFVSLKSSFFRGQDISYSLVCFRPTLS